jgi:GNAT superfamily N-acetyltransferase
MYCERCGHKVGVAGTTLGKCPKCGREFDLRPRWLDVLLMLLAFALVPTVALGLFAAGLRVATAALGIAVFAAVAFRVLVTHALVSAHVLRSAGFTREPTAHAREVAKLISKDEERLAQTEQALQMIPDFKPMQPVAQRGNASAPARRVRSFAEPKLRYVEVDPADATQVGLLQGLYRRNLQDAWGIDLAEADLAAWADAHATAASLAAQISREGTGYWLVYRRGGDAQAMNGTPAEAAPAPLGLLGLQPHGPEAPHTLDVIALYLDPAQRGKGLSRDLVAFAAKAADQLDMTHLALRVAKANPLASVSAEHLGFVRKGQTERRLAPDRYVAEYFYRLDLR